MFPVVLDQETRRASAPHDSFLREEWTVATSELPRQSDG
jgi:hypothetical protein